MSVWPAWEVREHGGTLSWLYVRLDFPDGAGVDALAVVSDGGSVCVEEIRARPALSLDDLSVLADWIEEPLLEAFWAGERAAGRTPIPAAHHGDPGPGTSRATRRRARPPWVRTRNCWRRTGGTPSCTGRSSRRGPGGRRSRRRRWERSEAPP
ncbi:DUF6214 family protein, partial [Streptomyces murinus]